MPSPSPFLLTALPSTASHIQVAPVILGDEEKDAAIDRYRLAPEFRINR